ncbi:hypothetical protein DPMN_086432 [Dreissena polymorpha]|uniref:G-protein coupled receptors family 1 profile domain-containing protein n=1 Tax=Dreissena polymorpha TaxID=45954 RepID=A0A9D4KQG5_DREPO|nr:hypothetical protein DPMN_086432 [Dreissena polymorpha]
MKEYYDLNDYVYHWIDFTLIFGTPFPLLLIGNVTVVVQLARSRSRRQRMNISGQARDTRPVSILMISLCVLFVFTITPVSVGMVNDVAVLVSYFNATFNFVIYVFSGSKFRAELRSLLCCMATQCTSLFVS